MPCRSYTGARADGVEGMAETIVGAFDGGEDGWTPRRSAEPEPASPSQAPAMAAIPIPVPVPVQPIAYVPMEERPYDFFINHCQKSGQVSRDNQLPLPLLSDSLCPP